MEGGLWLGEEEPPLLYPHAKLIPTSLRRIAHGIGGPNDHELGIDIFGNGE